MDNFDSFERLPFAAASIGQVHSAVLTAAASPTGKPAPVAVKIQFPNIVNSINSDLGYVKMLLTAGRLLPPGLFLDRTIQVMKEELADECDYTREAEWARRFRAWLAAQEGMPMPMRVRAPWVWEGSTKRVLVMEFVEGVSVGGDAVQRVPQAEKDLVRLPFPRRLSFTDARRSRRRSCTYVCSSSSSSSGSILRLRVNVKPSLRCGPRNYMSCGSGLPKGQIEEYSICTWL